VLVNVVVPAAVTVDVNPIKLAIAALAVVLPVPPEVIGNTALLVAVNTAPSA
jgi:hypothetical protein